MIAELRSQGALVDHNPRSGALTINQEFAAALVIARCRTRANGRYSRLIRREQATQCNLTIAARVTPDNRDILDYHLLPRGDELRANIRPARENSIVLDVHRFESLNYLCKISRKVRIGDAA